MVRYSSIIPHSKKPREGAFSLPSATVRMVGLRPLIEGAYPLKPAVQAAFYD